VVEFVAAELEEAPQDVLENERAVVTDVSIVVHGGAARIHADLAGPLGDEGLGFSGHCVVETDFGHSWSVIVTSLGANLRL
jgi:hypothetical protein